MTGWDGRLDYTALYAFFLRHTRSRHTPLLAGSSAHTAPLFAGTLTRTSSHPHTLAPVCGWARACLRGSSTRRLKAGCFLSPAVSCCHRGWLRCCPRFGDGQGLGGRTATPPPVRPTPRSGPHRDELPYRGQGEYRAVTHRNPERGRSLCGPEGSSEGSVAASSWACRCAQPARPL